MERKMKENEERKNLGGDPSRSYGENGWRKREN